MATENSSSNAGTAGKAVLRPLDQQTEKWALRERHVTRGTLERLGVGSGTAYIPELSSYCESIIFKYSKTDWRARALAKKAFVSKAGMKVGFWGLADVLEWIGTNPDAPIYIVEGEMDRCAMVEAGIDRGQVLSCPGASGKEDTKLDYVERALAEGLSKATKFVLCVDNDEAGLLLRKALVQILGVARCSFVDWPGESEGKKSVKDANDCLVNRGMDALRDIVENPKDWPSYGLYRINDVPREPNIMRWSIGGEGQSLSEMNKKIFLGAPCLSAVTGQPGHGKTQLMAQIWQQVAFNNDLVITVATFETRPRPHYQKILRQLHAKKKLESMSDDEIMAADDWIMSHYLFLQHPEQRPTLEWLLDQAEIAVTKHKSKVVIVDPWNRLEAQRDARETETDYIGRSLRNIYTFARDFSCHFQILAHPAKGSSDSRGKMPVLEDIAGSKHWENMVDQGFSVWRPRTFDDAGERLTYAEFHHLKARFSQLGYPTKFGVNFDIDAERYGVCALEKPKKDRK